MRSAVLLICCVAFAGGAAADVVTFQQDVDGYAGTVDTCFQKADSNDRSADAEVWTDGTGDPFFLSRQGIIRFENLFVSEGGPIPDGSIITSATLSIWIHNPGSGANIHRMLVNWASTANWNSLDSTNYPGVDNGWGCAQDDDDPGDDAGVEYVATPDDTHDPIVEGSPIDWDVTPSVTYWSANPGENWGWVWTILGGSNWAFRSSEHGTPSERPLLTIEYLAETNIGSFSVTDQTSGSTAYTDSATVDVSLTVTPGPGATVTDTMIREIPDEPLAGDAGWSGSGTLPMSYTITGGEGDKTLYAWVKDDGGVIAGKSAAIRYSTNAPVISGAVATPGPFDIQVDWDTGADALGWVMYGLQGGALDQMSAFSAVGQFHGVLIEGLDPDTAYDLEIHSDQATQALSVTTLDAPPTTDDVTWTGAGADLLWSNGKNWQDLYPPANPTPGTVSYGQTGSGTEGLIEEDRVIGAINARNGGNVQTSHTIDLGGNRLTVEGKIRVVYDGSTATALGQDTMQLEFKNGTLQLGSPGGKIDVSIGTNTNYRTPLGTVVIAPGATIDTTYLRTLSLAADGTSQRSSGHGRLDLRGVTVANGNLVMDNLYLGYWGYRWDAGDGEARLILDGSTSVSTLHVRGMAGLALNAVRRIARIGDPDDEWKLPADLNLTFGVPPQGQDPGSRGDLIMARSGPGVASAGGGHAIATIRASGGGVFTAYVNNLEVGTDPTDAATMPGNYADGQPTGTLDIRAMTSCNIDANNIIIGSIGSASGTVQLPTGTVLGGTVSVGGNPNRDSLLELNDTDFNVSTSLTLRDRGTATVNVGTMSSGFALDTGASFSILDGGKLVVEFLENPAHGDLHYGFSWPGSQVATLSALQVAGKIDLFVAGGVTGSANFFYDDAANVTYIALKETWPPMAVAHEDFDVEINPPDFTAVVLHVDDIDVSMPDPEVTARRIECPSDATPGDLDIVTLVNLQANDQFTITLTLTKGTGEQAAEASDDCVVTMVLPDPTTETVTWVGQASAGLMLMDRPEWIWGGNWEGGRAPDDAAPVNYDYRGADVDGILTADYSIGPVNFQNFRAADTNHIVDLAGNKLTFGGKVTGGGEVADFSGDTTIYMTFRNGTVQFGQPGDKVDVSLGYTGLHKITTAGIVIEPGATIDTTDLGTLSLGCDGTRAVFGSGTPATGGGVLMGQGDLDIRGATVAGGVFAVDNLYMSWSGYLGHMQQSSWIRMNNDTDMHTFHVRGMASIGQSSARQVYIGDPDNDWKLPANLNLKFGVDADNRGTLYVGRGMRGANHQLGWIRVEITASAGGTFTAWLDDMEVGRNAFDNPSNPNYDGAYWLVTGILDLREMDSCQLDATNLLIGTSFLANAWSHGRTYLPPGDATVADVRISDSNGRSSGQLHLYGTRFAVTNSLTVNQNGSVVTNVSGTSCGLDLGAGVTLAIDDGGVINIVFDDTAPGPGIYWGLRAEGDRLAELEVLNNDGKLTWDDTLLNIATGNTVTIFTDLTNTYTYVGVNTVSLDGDVNGDCVVNILDLIGIRPTI